MAQDDTGITSMEPFPSAPASPIDVATSAAPPRAAAEWGLAALLLAGCLGILALLFLLLGISYWVHLSEIHPGRVGGVLIVFVAALLVLLFWALSVASLVMGIAGLRSASTTRQPAPLPLAGAMLSAVVVVLWTGTAVALAKEGIDLLDRI